MTSRPNPVARWFGHPLAPEQHPKRPWWRREVVQVPLRDGVTVPRRQWRHPKGHIAYGDDAEELMASYDQEHPPEFPGWEVGQVWRSVRGDRTYLVTRMEGEKPFSGEHDLSGDHEIRAVAYVLLSGPGAPWCPADFLTP